MNQLSFQTRLRAVSRSASILAVCLAGYVAATTPARAQSFQGIGFLSGGTSSTAAGVSADGKTVAGTSTVGGVSTPFLWTNGVRTSLGLVNSSAQGISGDGLVVAGTQVAGNSSQAFRWANGATTQLGNLSNEPFNTAGGISRDGTTVVGTGCTSSTSNACVGVKWTSAGAPSPAAPNLGSSTAHAANSNGSVIIGHSAFLTPDYVSRNGVASGLPQLPNYSYTWLGGVSDDGLTIAGMCWSAAGATSFHQATVWSGNTPTALGFLPGDQHSLATAISGDGSVVFGRSAPGDNIDIPYVIPANLFRWTAISGIRSLTTLLTNAGVNLTGWRLDDVTGVSSDGTVFVGNGLDPSGHLEGWIAYLPDPFVPTLIVSPAADATITRTNGTFDPPAVVYNLNTTTSTVDYHITIQYDTNASGWLDILTAPNGTVGVVATNSNFKANATAATLPAGIYTATVTFTNGRNGKGTQTRRITLEAHGAGGPPTINTVVPATGPAAGGTSVSITGTNFTASTVFTFGTTPAPKVVINNSASAIVTTPAFAVPTTSTTTPTTITPSDPSATTPLTSAPSFLYYAPDAKVSQFSAVLPSSRSALVGKPITAFATIINSGTATGIDCGLTLRASIPATLSYQTTNAATNQATGAANTPVNIPPGGVQTYVFAITPTATISPTDVPIVAGCSNSSDFSATIVGLNTLLLSASATPVADIVALAATASNDGIVNIPGAAGSGAFAVATVNVGATSAIAASVDTGSASLPIDLTLCQTDPASGQCTSAIGPAVVTIVNANATPTFAIFAKGNATVPFDPANNRIFVRFRDGAGVTRGATSVAVRTQ